MKQIERLTKYVASGNGVVSGTMASRAVSSRPARRLGVAALTAIALGAAPAAPAAAESHEAAIRPFRVKVPGGDLADLKRRVAATRWPSEELVEDRSQGVQLQTMRELAPYWATEYEAQMRGET